MTVAFGLAVFDGEFGGKISVVFLEFGDEGFGGDVLVGGEIVGAGGDLGEFFVVHVVLAELVVVVGLILV